MSQYFAMLIQMLTFSMSAFGQTFFDPHKAFELPSQEKAVLVDVREAEEVKLGMAKGALWFPLSRVQGHTEDLEKFLANLSKDKLSLVYCRSGRRAETFVKILRERGFSAENLGGFDAWVQAGLPVTKGSAMTATKSDRIGSIHRRSHALAKDVVNFWMRSGVDWENGGFYGRNDLGGHPDSKADKGLIQQARHLWTFAFLRELKFDDQESAFAPISDHAFRFLSRFYVPEVGFFRFQMDATGSYFTDPTEQFYGNAFAIYSLAQYALVTKEHKVSAQDLALSAYRTLVQRGFDSKDGGFDQTNDPWYFTSDQRTRGFVKDYNTHLHLLEAFTVLYRLTNDADVGDKLENLVDVFLDKMIGGREYIPLVFHKDWSSSYDQTVSYGHDIESVWLIHEALRVLGRGDEKSALDKLVKVGSHAVRHGVDPDLGGWFEEGIFGQGVTKTNKVWWAQAEALPGLWKMYQWTNDVCYLDQIDNTRDWIEEYQRKKDVGEWYWEVKANGTPDLSRYGDIGSHWKTSYHTTRALVLLKEWTDSYVK